MQLPYLWVCKKIKKKTKQQQAVSTSHWNLLAIWCLLGVFPAIYAATVQENSRETFLLLIRCSRCTGEKEARESQEMWTQGLQALPLSPHLSSRSTTAQHTTISLIDQEITAILLSFLSFPHWNGKHYCCFYTFCLQLNLEKEHHSHVQLTLLIRIKRNNLRSI